MKAKWFIIIGAVLLLVGLLGGAVGAQSPAGQIEAVKLIGAWVDAGAPETAAFKFTGKDGKTYEATFNDDILPLFTKKDAWFKGSQPCTQCHFAMSDKSAHELDLGTYKGIMTGADSISSPKDPEKIVQAGKWSESSLRGRLRNNRMPPEFPFLMDESNRDGPCLEVSDAGVKIQMDGANIKYGCKVNAAGLIGAWADAKAPEKDAFTYSGAKLTFERDVLPFFTKKDMWFKGSQPCTQCHFAVSDKSAHEMDLGTYKGIMTGADSISSPKDPEKIVEPGKWSESSLRGRLRNNRMPPESTFLMDESNRDGPVISAGKLAAAAPSALPTTGESMSPANLGLVAWGLALIAFGLLQYALSRRRRS